MAKSKAQYELSAICELDEIVSTAASQGPRMRDGNIHRSVHIVCKANSQAANPKDHVGRTPAPNFRNFLITDTSQYHSRRRPSNRNLRKPVQTAGERDRLTGSR
ncbi:hypothetical protein IW262DRAFT_1295981 [Armillaria fumosa]|nr:hypothetical protein IW262DRAFT_1295981 [Armillaria fumosa]